MIKNLIKNNACYGSRTEDIDCILIHSCSDVLDNPKEPFVIENIIKLFEKHGVSAHYIIDREGVIYHLVEEEACAFHAGKGCAPWMPERENSLNDFSIGIELLAIGSEKDMLIHMSAEDYAQIPEEMIGYTQAQYKALNTLIDDITKRHNIPKTRKHIFGHDEYAPTRKTDPGELFDWAKVNLLG